MTWRRFALGAAVESLLLGLLLVWPNSKPNPPAVSPRRFVSLTAPLPLSPPPAIAAPLPRPRAMRELPSIAALPTQNAAVATPQPEPLSPPAPVAPPAPPKVATAVTPQPPQPQVGLFELAAADAPKVKRRIVEAGLDEPVPVSGGRHRPAVALAALDSAAGPATSRNRVVETSGGFGVAAKEAPRTRGPVAQAFAFETEQTSAPSRRLTVQEGAFRPVEILTRPKPTYTQAARQFGIEGEVVLQVKFLASGRLEVVQILRGLGHGLDENAALAAAQLQFRPAERDGMPVDQLATLRVQFQLAQ